MSTTKEFLIKKIEDLEVVATTLLPIIREHRKVALIGEIGAGKTTLVKVLCRLLGVEEVTSSPTFSIINEYQGEADSIYHIDLYRLQSEEEVISIGLLELLEQENDYCFIEWPNLVEDYLPIDTLWLKIEVNKSMERKIKIFFE
jgi:tRNA threonylcarbamoyladenosine biosynthesis protein TsaE